MSGKAMATLGTPERALQFKVTLVTGVGPIAPWRRVLLPADVSLYELGDALSDAMGWDGVYLFRYFIDGHMTPDYHGGEYLDDIQNLPVRDVLDDDVRKFEYEYDIGEEVRGGVMHVVEYEGETEATFAKEDAPQIAPGATRFRPISAIRAPKNGLPCMGYNNRTLTFHKLFCRCRTHPGVPANFKASSHRIQDQKPRP